MSSLHSRSYSSRSLGWAYRAASLHIVFLAARVQRGVAAFSCERAREGGRQSSPESGRAELPISWEPRGVVGLRARDPRPPRRGSIVGRSGNAARYRRLFI